MARDGKRRLNRGVQVQNFDLIREIKEFKNQLSYSKNIGFFMGAGCSCALGIPDIAQLTKEVGKSLEGKEKVSFEKIQKDLSESAEDGDQINIEDILNHVRRIREITSEQKDKKYIEISGEEAKSLDIKICKQIYEILSKKEGEADFKITKQFLAWFNMQNRDYSKEVFTINYDLIIEKALEEMQIPYFDGFVGSYEPFFWQESIDKLISKSDLTQNWIRLWKIHGSLNWFWKKNSKLNTHRVIRVGKFTEAWEVEKDGHELVIYPSKEKYDSSRKQPFIAYFDRFKNYLLNGELLFFFSGYSFSDEHINEIIFNSLRQNNRLSMTVFLYDNSEVEELFKVSAPYLNLTVYGPTKAIINGAIGEWQFDKDDLKQNEGTDLYWDKSRNCFLLGDFAKLVTFFITNSNKEISLEESIDG